MTKGPYHVSIRVSGLLTMALALVAAAADAHAPRFEDRSDRLVGDFARGALPGTLPIGGLAWLDYDADDDLDLFVTSGDGAGNALYRNDGDDGFVDVASDAGVDLPGHAFAAAVAGDLDNDGFPDLLVLGDTSGLPGARNAVLHNRGDGTFADVTAGAGIPAAPDSLSAALLDYDGDGLLDVFVAGFGSVGLPESFGLVDDDGHPVTWDARTGTSRLFRNLGGLRFADISAAAGIGGKTGSCAVAASDYDRDGDVDVIVANCNLITEGPVGGNCPIGFPCPVCSGPGDPGPCRPAGSGGNPLFAPFNVWRNNGDGTFTDVVADPATGLAGVFGAFMSVTPGDVDGDGDVDFFATNVGAEIGGPHALLRNEGDGTFTEVAAVAGVATPNFGWGASFADYDGDGDLDLFHHGNLAPLLIGPFGNPGRLYRNDGRGGFAEVPSGVDLAARNTSGSALADYDGDGDPDLAIAATAFTDPGGAAIDSGAPILLRNRGGGDDDDSESDGDGDDAGGWLTVRLFGIASNAQGIGARVRVSGGGRTQLREIYAGSSFASSETPWPSFATGETEADVLVEWPSGLRECFRRIATGRVAELVEGTGKKAKRCG